MATYIGSTLRTGSDTLTDSVDGGYVVVSQSNTIAQNSTSAVSTTFTLPASSQIINVFIDVLTAFNSATSATLTMGTAAAGTQYVSGVDAKTAGRAAPTLTATQLSNMASIGTNTSVVATVTPVGATSAGSVRVTVVYAQKAS
jgi:hypothetical protein